LALSEVGLGFGLQDITSNFFSGLILLLERQSKIGDRVEIGGVVGEVREIGARATTIVTDESVAMPLALATCLLRRPSPR
jgi:small-conductance mechanosensitive channel